MPTVVFRGSRAELGRLLAGIPAVLAGRAPDPVGIARGIGYRMANVLLSAVQSDFLVKARGGVGRDGIRWAPLAPATVAKRMAKERKALRGKDPKTVPYAGQYEIGRDTGRMLRSLAAGAEDHPSGAPDQVVKLGRGELVIGTTTPYAAAFHEGRPGRQPPRPITPPQIPDAYLPGLVLAMARGLVAAVEMLLRGAR